MKFKVSDETHKDFASASASSFLTFPDGVLLQKMTLIISGIETIRQGKARAIHFGKWLSTGGHRRSHKVNRNEGKSVNKVSHIMFKPN